MTCLCFLPRALKKEWCYVIVCYCVSLYMTFSSPFFTSFIILLHHLGKRGGTNQWMPHVNKLIMEILANRTHPTCIQKNILTVARVIHPNLNIVCELPCLNHIRNMRTVLASTSKTLAALRLARAQVWKHLHTDETSQQ